MMIEGFGGNIMQVERVYVDQFGQIHVSGQTTIRGKACKVVCMLTFSGDDNLAEWETCTLEDVEY